MIALNAHYDGKVIVPDEPLDLPADQKVRISIELIESIENESKLELGLQRGNLLYLAPDFDDPLPDDIWGLEDAK